MKKQIHCQPMAVYLLHKTRSLVECSLLCQQKVECYTYRYINHGACVMYKNEYIDTSTPVADDTVIYYFPAMIWWHTVANRSVPDCRVVVVVVVVFHCKYWMWCNSGLVEIQWFQHMFLHNVAHIQRDGHNCDS